MAFRTLKVLAFVSCIIVSGIPAPAQACCWLFGGGWGAFRPLTWGSYYRGGWGGYNCCYGGYGYPSSCGSGCCGVGTGCCGAGTGCCGAGTGCSSGCCGSQSFYGPACDSCSQCGYMSSSCGSGCCGTYYGGTGDCCSQSTSDPLPTPNSTPGDDSFRSRSSIPATPPSSIPATPPANAPNPTYNPNPANAPEYDINRGTQDLFPNNGAGTDAVPFEQPRQPAPGDPLDPNLRDIHFEIEPLEVNSLVDVAYRPHRERVNVWSTRSPLPHIAAKPLPEVNAGWEPVQVSSRVAQR